MKETKPYDLPKEGPKNIVSEPMVRKIVPSEGGINFHMDIYVGSDVSDKQIARLRKEKIF